VRILIVSNFYPPHALGGYELGCRDVVDALRARGHAVTVLTSWHGVGAPSTDGHVLRWLHAAPFDPHVARRANARSTLLRREVSAQRAFDRAVQRSRPHVVYLWNLARLPIALAHRAESQGPASYYISDQWLAHWTEPGWYEDLWHQAAGASDGIGSRLTTAALRTAFGAARLTWPADRLRLPDVQFCSAFLRDVTMRAGRIPLDSEVVHWGVDCSRFPNAGRPRRTAPGLRLLVAGQLLPHKGAHTAIEAVRQLHQSGESDVTLTIAGAAHDPAYLSALRRQVAASGLDAAIRFIGPQPRERLPHIYGEHDVLVFPSCGDEPFAITPLEAMAAGLVVVGTLNGGSREVFDDGVNALTFACEDAAACAAQLRRLARDVPLSRRLAECGRRTVLGRFTLERMVDRIEARLERTAEGVSHGR
jgi:glycosyltransferase involved in cell wall biosynthesis